MKKWVCIICGFIYDEAEGWPEDGIPPGTKWEDVPEDWACPDCGVGKADFEMIELDDDAADERTAINAIAPAITDARESLDTRPIVIVGSGHAGYDLAQSLRKAAPDLEIHVFTADDGARYSKPALSNAFAMGKDDGLLLDESALEIERRLSLRVHAFCPVEHIDCQRQIVTTSKGELAYSKLVLATGASPIRLPIEDPADAMLSINNRRDYKRFRSRVAEAPSAARIVIVGDGLIGCEFANDLIQAGFDVDVVGLGDRPMPRLLPDVASQQLKTALEATGVNWYFERSVEAIHRRDGDYAVALTDGETLGADIVISAVGLAPNTEVAEQAGIVCRRGIVVDDDLSTSQPNVYAIGDAIEIGGTIRPYLAPIEAGLPALIKTLTGHRTPVSYPPMPIRVKTPAAPSCVLPPPADCPGRWLENTGADGVRSGFYDADNRLLGFALVGRSAVGEQRAWLEACQMHLAVAS